MRFYERQEKETTKAWEAFKIYRDQGPGRTHLKTSELMGKTPGYCRSLERWSVKYDWVARARAYDDYHEMLKQGAIEEHEKRRATEIAERKAKIEERYVELEELALDKAFTIAKWPLEKRESKDGKTIVMPARWSFNTLVRLMEQLDPNPDKVAFTDPTGQHEYRADQPENEAEARRWFEEVLGVKLEEREE